MARGPTATRRRLVGAFALAAAVVADRAYWSTAGYWREDPAVNLWLAWHYFRQPTPVGLMSSVAVPTPPGMALIGIPLTWLPSLGAVGLALGCAQALAVAWLCYEARRAARAPWLLVLPLLSAVALRAIGHTFVNQWMFVTINGAFLALLFRDMRRPAMLHQVAAVALIVLSPIVYMAGLANAILFAALWFLPPALRRARRAAGVTPRAWIPCAVLAALLVAALLIPFAREWDPAYMSMVSQRSVRSRVVNAVAAPVLMPVSLLRWVVTSGEVQIFGEPPIPSPAAQWSTHAATGLLVVQSIVAALAMTAWLRARYQHGWSTMAPPLRVLLLFVLGISVLPPLLGGDAWHRGFRIDQGVQVLPAVLLVVFGTPWWLRPCPDWTRRAATTLIIAYSVVSLAAGVLLVRSHLDYRGPAVTLWDVPLGDKERVVDWIAADWAQRASSRDVPVAYALFVGPPELGHRLDRWYPGLYRVGRAFDYELLHRFGLRNAFEGRREDANRHARYVVSYADDALPLGLGHSARHVIIGRLRLSVVDRPPGGN